MRALWVRRRVALGPIVAAIALIVAHPAHAQSDERGGPPGGDRALAFGIYSSTEATLGMWRRGSGARWTIWEARIGASRSWGEDNDATGRDDRSVSGSLTLSPALRWYRLGDGPVSPFVQAGVHLGYRYSEFYSGSIFQAREGHTWTASFGATAAIGAEWFPRPGIGISAWTGLALTTSRTERLDRDLLQGSRRLDIDRSVRLETQESYLTLAFYY